VAFLLGVVVLWAELRGLLNPFDPTAAQLITGAAVVLTVGGGLVLLRDWVQDRFPSERRRREIADSAAAIGLAPVEAGGAEAYLDFSFVRPVPRSPFATLAARFIAILTLTIWLLFAVAVLGLPFAFPDQQTRLLTFAVGTVVALIIFVPLSGLTSLVRRMREPIEPRAQFLRKSAHPIQLSRISHVYAAGSRATGTATFNFDLDVGSTRQEWTCAVVPTATGTVELEIRRSATELMRFGRRATSLNDPELEKSYHLRAFPESALADVVTGAVRAHLLDKAAPETLLIQVHDRHLLYCGPRLTLDGREPVLDAARRFAEALPNLEGE
jgi:hypothetical protein